MKATRAILLLQTLTYALLCTVKCNAFSPRPGKDLPGELNVEIRKSYQSFAVDLMREFVKVRKMGEPVGAECISPISVAYLLAVAHSKIWPVPTEGFDKVLHLQDHEIQDSYQQIVDHLTSDTNLFLRSNVLTSTKGLQTPQNLSDLRTRVSYIDYHAPNTNDAIRHINAMISGQTFGKNYETLIPLGGWYGSAIYNYTLGVFLNTLYFNGEWVHPFYHIGPMEFAGGNQTTFLEAFGDFAVFQGRDYRAVRIPLKHNSKVLMLVQPRNGKGIQDFVEKNFHDFLEQRLNKSVTTLTDVRIRVPAFNFSLLNSFAETFMQMGLRRSLCEYKLKNINTFEGFSQSSYAHFGEDKFEIAYATGAALSNVKGFRETYQLDDRDNSSAVQNHDEVLETTTERQKSASETTSAPSNDANISSEDTDALFVFDSPFLWYFEDEQLGLGPLVLGTFETAPLRNDPDEAPEGFEWLQEIKRYMYFSCPDNLASS